MEISQGDTVTMEYTGRRTDGSVFDTSREAVAEESGLSDEDPDREYDPITVDIGDGQLIEGVEEALIGLEEGNEITVEVPPEKGYGQPSEDRIVEEDADEFAQMVGEEPTEGTYVETQDGAFGEVVDVDEETVRIDFNHELAGETLEFDVEVVEVR
ncbi:MAG: FKBP-type peptidyl-prolyl cis-trans isomerase 2 [Halobacteriales archaeon]|jgi:FKBP-type peptidyl-prolyl cis-trans isomerase 2